MGLMSWLRGGRSTSGAPSPAREDNPRPDRGDRVDVNRLAPVQRSVTEQDLVIDPGGFQAALATRQETALGTPLGHLVSPEAPAGLVHGVADAAPGSPAPAVQRVVEMPLRPQSRTGPVAVAVQRGYGDSAPALTSAEASTAAAGLPVRQLVGEQPLVPRMEQAGPPESGTDPAAGTATGPASGTDAQAVQRVVASPPAQPPRRVPGLGAPLPGLPPTAQRQAAQSPAAQPPLPRPPLVQREVAPVSAPPPGGPADPGDGGGPVDPQPAEASAGAESAEPVAPLLGDDPLTGAVAGGEGPGGDESGGNSPAADPAATPAFPVQRSIAAPDPVPGTGAGLPTAPLLGDRPLSLRAAEGPDRSGPSAGAVVQRSAGGGGASRPSLPDGPSGNVSDGVPVRWVTADPGMPSASSAAPLPAAAVPLQRHTGGGPPVPGSAPVSGAGPGARGGSRTPLPTAGAFAVAAGVAQRMADGSVVFGSAPMSGTSRPVVQRDSEIAEEPPPLPEPEPGPVPEPEGDAGPEAGPAAGEGGTGPETRAGAPAGQGAPPVTDELVRALYAPLSRLLKADLRLERERAGYLINTRH